jgi:beta-galactosidase GanA
LSLFSSPLHAAAQTTPIPRIVHQDNRYALLVDGAPYLMLGAQINNSSAWPDELPKVWPMLDNLHANTIEAPIYWEQFEPTQGHFDPSVLHTLIDQAREHHVHLVLLWFGTWKNASGHYTPPFIKLDEARVPHVTDREGQDAPGNTSASGMVTVAQLAPNEFLVTVVHARVDFKPGLNFTSPARLGA